jgi:hypothetical protein
VCGDCYISGLGGVPARSLKPDGRTNDHPAEGAALLPLVLGAALGFVIGYLLRPSVLLVGQLPFEIVITGGSQLSGLDGILVPAARQSLGMVIGGALLGGVAGWVVQKGRKTTRSPEVRAPHGEPTQRRSRRRTSNAEADGVDESPVQGRG